MSSDIPLKIKDASGDLQRISSSEENYLAYQLGLQLSAGGYTVPGALVPASEISGIDSDSLVNIGSFTDTYFEGSEPGNTGSAVVLSSAQTSLYQYKGLAEEKGRTSYRRPLYHDDSDLSIHEMDSDQFNVCVTRLLGIAMANEYPGTYRLGSSSPSANHEVNSANIFQDTRIDGTTITYNLYRKVSESTPPAKVNSVSLKKSGGHTGDYQGIQAMTDAQMKFTYGQRARTIKGYQGNIGSYQLRSSVQGFPTDTGTWVARGVATDTRNQDSLSQFARDYLVDYTRQYSKDYVGSYAEEYILYYGGLVNKSYVETYVLPTSIPGTDQTTFSTTDPCTFNSSDPTSFTTTDATSLPTTFSTSDPTTFSVANDPTSIPGTDPCAFVTPGSTTFNDVGLTTFSDPTSFTTTDPCAFYDFSISFDGPYITAPTTFYVENDPTIYAFNSKTTFSTTDWTRFLVDQPTNFESTLFGPKLGTRVTYIPGSDPCYFVEYQPTIFTQFLPTEIPGTDPTSYAGSAPTFYSYQAPTIYYVDQPTVFYTSTSTTVGSPTTFTADSPTTFTPAQPTTFATSDPTSFATETATSITVGSPTTLSTTFNVANDPTSFTPAQPTSFSPVQPTVFSTTDPTNVTYVGQYTRQFASPTTVSYLGDYTRQYTAVYQRAYEGQYTGRTASGPSQTIETYTLYVRIA